MSYGVLWKKIQPSKWFAKMYFDGIAIYSMVTDKILLWLFGMRRYLFTLGKKMSQKFAYICDFLMHNYIKIN